MKRSLLLIATYAATTSTICAQHNNEFYNNGSLVHIQAGAEVHVIGDVHMRGVTGTLENNGLLKADGDLYSDNLFQQRGTGTTRIQNNLANIGQTQKISGNYAVRGGQAQTGVNDGSFYNLQLANDQGIVWLETNAIAGSTPYVADVRNSVDYLTTVYNRIITHNPAAIPANGSGYSAVFGIMNPAAGQGSAIDNTVTLNGNMSGVDAGFVQGKMRRAISPAGGQYPYVIGLEPAGAGAQRGMQYTLLDFGPNTYDVLEGYFQTGLDNTFPAQLECSGYLLDYWGGVDHGQWIFDDISGFGTGVYSVRVWPQDDNFPAKTVWLVTKDNSVQGTPDECGPTPVGLVRGGFNGFSQFGVAAADVNPLPVDLLKIWAVSKSNHIEVNWTVGSEQNVSHYELLRSDDDGVSFEFLTQLTAAGNSQNELTYSYDDYAVLRNKDYYYRYRSVDFDGQVSYSPVVSGRIMDENSWDGLAFNVYPNPSSGEFTLSLSSEHEEQLSVEVFNTIGQIVLREELFLSKGQTAYQIKGTEWSAGMYNLRISNTNTGNESWIKLIKN
jgi:hypothetical protein